MRSLIVVPGGLAAQHGPETIPVLQEFVARLASRCDVTVVSLSRRPEPGSNRANAGFRMLYPRGSRGPWTARTIAARVRRMLRTEGLSCDVVHSFWLGQPGRVARMLSRATGAGWIAAVGGQELFGERLDRLGRVRRWHEQRERARALSKADAVTAGSRFVLTQLEAWNVAARWLPLFPDRERFRPLPRAPDCTGRPFRIVTIADHNATKDPETLLCMIAELKRRSHAVRLDWIGRELEPGAAAKRAGELGVAAETVIHGHVPHDQIAEHLAGADVYVQSSRYESQGVAICEAAATGIPIVGTDVGLVAEMAPVHALAAPVGEPVRLADCVELVMRDADKRERLGRAALEWLDGYSIDWTVQRTLELYAAVRAHAGRR